MSYELKFDPQTIEHLGVKMYSTLPPALAELISNSYDADSESVKIKFFQSNSGPLSIQIIDNGIGMSSTDIQNKFLVIGRNRRKDGDIPTSRFGRYPTGKKGLGKLALFGLAHEVTVDTVRDGLRNRFVLDWNELISADGVYKPKMELNNKKTNSSNGTTIKLSKLKRKSNFDLDSIADSLSKIFIVNNNFKIILEMSGKKSIEIDNERKYKNIDIQYSWSEKDIDLYYKEYDVKFNIITTKTPISSSSGMRGISIFSRGKLVNLPEYFTSSSSSHFYQYLTGWIEADFIDSLSEDVISTNRQSINWDNDEMIEFRKYLSETIMKISREWRAKRVEGKNKEIKDKTGIDKQDWFSKLPEEVKKPAEKIISILVEDDAVSESFNPVISALYEIIPAYPELHWRHLNAKVRDRVLKYYENKQYAEAADQATKIYGEYIRELSGSKDDGTKLADVFSIKTQPAISVADITTESGRNIQEGQGHLTRGVMQGFRNPINHSPIDTLVPSIFNQLDCLNVLSLISYLCTRLDNAKNDNH